MVILENCNIRDTKSHQQNKESGTVQSARLLVPINCTALITSFYSGSDSVVNCDEHCVLNNTSESEHVQKTTYVVENN